MKFAKRDNINESFAHKEHTLTELNELSFEELDSLIPIDEEASSYYLQKACAQTSWFHLPYYIEDEFNENHNDEYYEMRFDEVVITPEMEERRIKYNHNNVDVLNDLLDSYFNKHNGIPADYDPINGWPKYHNVVTAIGHGFPQEIVYKALQECFGEKDARNTWLKYYDELPIKESSYDQYHR